MATRIRDLLLTDHVVEVPLDHARPDGRTIEVFAREAVAADRSGDDLPWLLFLQGGPGGKSPRPGSGAGDAWVWHAAQTHRVLLLDQRGTGRSTPITARTVRGLGDAELALWRLAGEYKDRRMHALAAQTFADLGARFPNTQYDAWYSAAEVFDKQLKDPAQARDAYLKVPLSSSHYNEAQKRARR